MDGSSVRSVRRMLESTLGKACNVAAETGLCLALAWQKEELTKQRRGRNKKAARLWASGCHHQQPAANLGPDGRTCNDRGQQVGLLLSASYTST